MSAVGLLLLEDPKARARAEARIRAGKGNRRSFFGRSGYNPGKGRQPSLPATIPDEDGEDSPVIVRPNTSLSIPVPGRKKSEPSDRSSNVSRNSIFGRKNSVGEASIKSGTSSSSQYSVPISIQPAANPQSEAERRDNSRQPATLPPVQYQYGQRTILPALETVDEKNLPAKLRAVPEYDRPAVQTIALPQDDGLSDVESEPAAADSRPITPLNTNPPSLPPACRISRFDETMFSELTEASADPSDRVAHAHAIKQALRDQRFSVLLNPKEQLGLTESAPQVSPACYDAKPSSQVNSGPQRAQPIKTIPATNGNGVTHVSRETEALFASSDDRDVAYHSKRVLPPVPEQQQPSGKSSDSSLGSACESSSSSVNPEIRVDRTLTPSINTNVRSSGSISGKSPAVSFTGDVRESMIFSDSTWEDDIDFVYEQGAEAACDFDWDSNQGSRLPSMHSDSAVHLSEASSRKASIASEVSRRDSRTLSGGGATIAERRQAQRAVEYTRGYSVGHRGFAAARNSTDDVPLKKGPIPSYMNIPRPMKDDNLSPVFNVPNAEDGSSTPSSMIHFPVPPAGGRLSDNLSEAESWRNDSKHRKSSSYGSLESFARNSVATSGKETNRWSVASGSSAPPLVHSEPKRTSSLSKTMISAPLESLPPREETRKFEVVDSRHLRRVILPGAEDDDAFMLRRPRTSGERRILQAAGSQRYRPSDAAPVLRHFLSADPVRQPPQASTKGLGWI